MTSRSLSGLWFRRLKAPQQTLLWSVFFLVLLQVWHPYYFLTADNLTGWLPVALDIGRHLRAGESPFVNSYLFGGNYQLLRDPNSLLLWNPILLLSSWALESRAPLALADISASFHLLVCACSFTLLLGRLRDVRNLQLSDGRMVFLSLSFTFCSYALVVGPSWLTFLANQASLPILLLGLLHPRRSNGVLLVALGFLYALLCGHLSPLIFMLLFFSLFVIALSFVDKSGEKLVRWSVGLALALIVTSPLLIPAVQGFGESTRNLPYSVGRASTNDMPIPILIASFFGDYFSVAALFAAGFYQTRGLQAFAGCAASGLVFGSLGYFGRRRTKLSLPQRISIYTSLPGFDVCLLLLLLIVAVFITRPQWLGEMLSHLPLFRSLRWPFREVIVWVFFAHLWIAVRPVVVSRRRTIAMALVGASVFVASALMLSPWSFRHITLDRELLISGQAHTYWARIKKTLGPNDQIIAVVDPKFETTRRQDIPYILLGAFNYPSQFQVRTFSGYTSAGLSKSQEGEDAPYHWGGIFSPEVGARLLARHPNLKAMHLVSLTPLRIEIRSATSRREVELPPLVAGASRF